MFNSNEAIKVSQLQKLANQSEWRTWNRNGKQFFQ